MRLINPQKMFTQSSAVTNAPKILPPNGNTASPGKGIKPNNLVVIIDPPTTRTPTMISAANRNPALGPATEMKICSFDPKATFAQRFPHNVDSGTVSPPEKCRMICDDNP